MKQLRSRIELLLNCGIVSNIITLHHNRHELHQAKSSFLALQIQFESRFLINK